MERLTNKDYKEYASPELDELISFANINPNDVCKSPVKELREQQLKLGQLEDIEEELGVSLPLYYKMCIKGCELYSKPDINVVQYYHKYIYHAELKCFCLMIFSALTPMYYVKDYGKTWALTKEEL